MVEIHSPFTKKIFIIIPALNEAITIGDVIQRIPRDFDKSCEVLVVVIDDGSTDATSKIAKDSGADYVLRHSRNMGVAAAVKDGIRLALAMGADIICTIDADGQFDPMQIPQVIHPILYEETDLVIGSRFCAGNRLTGISFIRLLGNIIVAKIISKIIATRISDAESGFRAVSRRAALALNLVGYFTFTHDMILDIWFQGLSIVEVPVSVRYFHNRKSRAVRNVAKYSLGILSLLVIKFIRLFLAMLFGHKVRDFGRRFGIFV